MIRSLNDGVSPRERRVIVFDFDGTLANTLPSIVATARQVLKEYGMSEEEMGDVSRLVGPPFPQAFNLLYGVSMDDAIAITERYRELYDLVGKDAWPLFDGVPSLLAKLRAAGKKLAIASSKKQGLVARALDDNDAFGAFDAVCGKLNDIDYSKADAIAAALGALGAKPSEALMVGDRKYDAHAAHELGIPCVGATWGGAGSTEELVEAGCVAVVDTVDELAELLLA